MEVEEHGGYTVVVEGESEYEADDELSASDDGESGAGCGVNGLCGIMVVIVSACEGDLIMMLLAQKQASRVTV